MVETVGESGDWTMRVVPNLYPAFEGEEGFAVRHVGPVHVMAEGTGIHEVFVYSNDHEGSLDQLDDTGAGQFMLALKDRFADHATYPNIRYTQAIVNHGREAGASIAHPHGQLLGLPFVPGEVLDEERAFGRFAGGCLLCTTVEAEIATGDRVVFANDDVAVICPYWSGSPYELLIVPRRHELHLQDADDASLEAVGRALRDSTTLPEPGDRRRRVQRRVPHGTARPRGRVPLAHPRVAESRDPGRFRAWHRRDDQHHAAGAGGRHPTRQRLSRRLLMGRIDVAVEIDAPPASVWCVIEPIEQHVEWMVDAVSIRFTSETTKGVGTTFECDTKVGPITLTDVMEVTEWETGRRMGVRHIGVVTGTGLFELQPIDLDRRTRFTWTEELDFPWFLGGPVGEAIGGRAVLKRIWRRNLRTLKTLVENQPSRITRR